MATGTVRLSRVLLAVAAAAVAAGCGGESSTPPVPTSATSSTSSTTVEAHRGTSTAAPPPTDHRLLAAADVGAEFENVPYRPNDEEMGACSLALPTEPVPAERLGAGYTSSTAMEQASVELLVHADAGTASVAFVAAKQGSACRGEENVDEGGGIPQRAATAGADEAFSIGYVDPNGSTALTVARVGETLVVARARFHFGLTTSDGVSSNDLADGAVDHLS